LVADWLTLKQESVPPPKQLKYASISENYLYYTPSFVSLFPGDAARKGPKVTVRMGRSHTGLDPYLESTTR